MNLHYSPLAYPALVFSHATFTDRNSNYPSSANGSAISAPSFSQEVPPSSTQAETDSMQIIRDALSIKSISGHAAETIISSWRPSSRKQ